MISRFVRWGVELFCVLYDVFSFLGKTENSPPPSARHVRVRLPRQFWGLAAHQQQHMYRSCG
jgi:hypothetical protein